MKIKDLHINNTASKYHAEASGGYASKKEHRRANELHIMERAGIIKALREQVPFELIPTQRDPKTKRVMERACHYVADFVYLDKDGNLIVEDTKGMRTREYRIKKKLMLYVHGIKIKES